jgi:hypothetical protein
VKFSLFNREHTRAPAGIGILIRLVPERLAALDAAMKPTFTLGIEEEYQTVDPETRDLRSHIHAEIIEKGKLVLQERVKTEMHQSVVEVGTSVCRTCWPCRRIRLSGWGWIRG